MEVTQWARELLLGDDLPQKLLNVADIEIDSFVGASSDIDTPGRVNSLRFSHQKQKFPKVGTLHLNEKKAMALHSFANHELLAIEMMAQALLKFPHETKEQVKLKRGIISTIKDEQKHLKLYINRLNEIGYEFGDFPLNDYFFRAMKDLRTMEEFLAVMSLTFESANLDFSIYYAQVFKELEDFKTAEIMKIVYEDEISHVALGSHYLNLWKEDRTLWEYYREILPFPISPARAKGQFFNNESRLRAGLPPDYVENLKNYTGDFDITKRKNWDTK